MVTAVNTVTTTGTNTSTSTNSVGTDPQQAQDRFLTLLVAQMNNQDPMNPMDNAQMTSQMAQINTVTGIQQLNQTVKSLTDQFSALQTLQGASMVGRDVMVEGNSLVPADGVGQGGFKLSGPADKVTVSISNASGQVVGNLELGSQTAGQKSFEWDASRYTGTGPLKFTVQATQGGQAVATTTLSRERVLSTSNNNGSLSLQLARSGSVDFSKVQATY